jgi:hypothetical protein
MKDLFAEIDGKAALRRQAQEAEALVARLAQVLAGMRINAQRLPPDDQAVVEQAITDLVADLAPTRLADRLATAQADLEAAAQAKFEPCSAEPATQGEVEPGTGP